MNFEPQKLFIGLVDFFSVWVPGAALVYLLKDDFGTLLLNGPLLLDDTEAWIVFLFASYVTGQFAFLVGAFFDNAYDAMRCGSRPGQISRLAKGKRLSPRWIRRFGEGRVARHDAAQSHAARLKGEHLGGAGAAGAINAFQWCKARLTLKHPEALAQVDRFEADSKFFRTFLAILPLLLLWQVIRLLAAPAEFVAALESVRMADIHRMAVLGLVGTVIFGFAAWRYFERRLKSTTQAYWFLITLECVRGDEGLAKRKPGEPTHAGGIVVKRVRGDVQVLLVKAKASEKWVLPKGHIEPGESAAEAAVREVQEETGVWARVHDELGTAHFAAGTEAVEVKFFLMEFLEESKGPPARPRQRSWLPQPTIERRETDWRSLDGAWELPDLPESSALLDEARRRFKAPKVRPSPARPAPSPQSSRRPAP